MEKVKWNGNDHYKRLLKDSSWDGGSLSFEKDKAYGFSWPQRNYICTFCKKEFKSAQALGGHMNVHRRDRARMRLSSPSSWDSSTFNIPNPNPSISFSSTTKSPSPNIFPCNNYKTSFSLQEEKVSVVVGDLKRGDADILKKICEGEHEYHKGKKNRGEMTSLARRKDARVWKEGGEEEYVRLDLNMGLIQNQEEDLDLELRLGYS